MNMRKLLNIIESEDFSPSIEESLKDEKDNPCWNGYHPVGTKKKNGKTVPNCVPKETVKEQQEYLFNLIQSLIKKL